MAVEVQTKIVTKIELSAPEVEIAIVSEDDVSTREGQSPIITKVEVLAPEVEIATNTEGFVLSAKVDNASPMHDSALYLHFVDGLQTNASSSAELVTQ